MSAAGRARIIVTTSHRPTQRVRSFAKDLASVLPEAVKINRGKATLQDLYYEAYNYGAERVVIIGVKKGNPGVIRVYKPGALPEEGLQLMATISLRGVRLRRETPGAQRIFGVKKLGIDARRVNSEEAARVVDVVLKSFLGKLVLHGEDEWEKYDVIGLMEEKGGIVELTFLCPHTRRVCGPTLRISAVTDAEAKVHVYLEKREVLRYAATGKD
ncbi:Brix domain protein [Pyrolobus fumarii 1A]|uniref:Probable Brix domain-containing ribosomal biogenesis protein n=1 Tax=Pyrolobus fumarii (strain DSM 11204 / 1A) TaxID=694429 RepID=G0EDA9_PYRF1|nr:Brix domain containing protein [Pyrolobus fumarii]AEM39787.1 Brix domain protein [Pyrolobus fumarii 1A]